MPPARARGIGRPSRLPRSHPKSHHLTSASGAAADKVRPPPGKAQPPARRRHPRLLPHGRHPSPRRAYKRLLSGPALPRPGPLSSYRGTCTALPRVEQVPRTQPAEAPEELLADNADDQISTDLVIDKMPVRNSRSPGSGASPGAWESGTASGS